MQIRILAAADAGPYQIIRLRGLRECPTAFSSSYEEECDEPLQRVAERLASNPDRAAFGAFVADKLVGVAAVWREEQRKLAHKATIWTVYVAPECRRQGIARRLLQRVLQHAFAMPGIRQVNLGVNATNAAAMALYAAAGFEAFGLERGFMMVNGVPQDEVMMVCRRGAVA